MSAPVMDNSGMNGVRTMIRDLAVKIGFAGIAGLVLICSQVSMAQEPAPTGDKPPEQAAVAAPADGKDKVGTAKTREWIGSDSKKVVEITFDEEKVYGKVQKPGVDYLISQGETNYVSLPLDRNIVEELKSSVDGNPF